jgi:hypothetical protein
MSKCGQSNLFVSMKIQLKSALESAKKDALSEVVKTNLMPMILSSGYRFDDLLDALADWAEINDFGDVVQLLEEAAIKVKKERQT